MKNIINHLQSVDPILSKLILSVDPLPSKEEGSASFHSLLKIIINQQLSDKAATTIHRRVLNLLGTDFVSESIFLTKTKEQILACGLSNSKYEFSANIAYMLIENPNFLESLDHMNDSDVLKTLISIKGLGNWSAQIFMLFHMGRENVFPENDVTLKKVYQIHYKNSLRDQDEMLQLWAPYCSYVARYFWHWWDSGQPKVNQ